MENGEVNGGAAEPYAGFAEDLAKHRERAAQAAEASGAVLPGPLRKAFAAEPAIVRFERPEGGAVEFTLQKVTAGLVTVLVRLESPLLEVVRAYAAGKSAEELSKLNPAPEAMVETVFAFVTPAPKLRALLARGRQALREAAMVDVGDRLHPAELAEMEREVARHYAESFLTALQYEAMPDPGGNGTVFSEPPAGKVTGSAGG